MTPRRKTAFRMFHHHERRQIPDMCTLAEVVKWAQDEGIPSHAQFTVFQDYDSWEVVMEWTVYVDEVD